MTAVRVYTGLRVCFLAAVLQYGDKSKLSAITFTGVVSCSKIAESDQLRMVWPEELCLVLSGC